MEGQTCRQMENQRCLDGWTDRWTDRQMERRTDREMDIPTDRQMNRQTDRQTDRQTMDRLTDRQTDNGQTSKQTDRKMDRQMDRWTDRQTDKWTYRQTEKYSQEQLPGGYTPTLIPLVFEHFGVWGEEASTFLNKLSKLYRDEEGRNNPSDFKTHWRRRLSVQLQRCNASVLARKMIRVTYGQNTDQSLDVVQLSIQ